MIHFPKTDDLKETQSPIVNRDTIIKTFGISKTTLQRWTKLYGLPYHKISRRVFFKTDELNEWFEQFKLNKPFYNES